MSVWGVCDGLSVATNTQSAELSHILTSDCGGNIQKTVINSSELVCAGLWAPPWAFVAWPCLVLGPTGVANHRFPVGSFKFVGVISIQARPHMTNGLEYFRGHLYFQNRRFPAPGQKPGIRISLGASVRGPVGAVCGRFWARLGTPRGPNPVPNRPQTTPTGPRTTSKCSHMSGSHIHRSPKELAQSLCQRPLVESQSADLQGHSSSRIRSTTWLSYLAVYPGGETMPIHRAGRRPEVDLSFVF
jgi:hypothetical protein